MGCPAKLPDLIGLKPIPRPTVFLPVAMEKAAHARAQEQAAAPSAPPPQRGPIMPFGLVHYLPAEMQAAFIRIAAVRARWRAPKPSLAEIATGLEEPKRPYTPTWEQMIVQNEGKPRWTRADGSFDIEGVLQAEAQKGVAYLEAKRDYERFRKIAAEAARLLTEITPPPSAGITELGISLIQGDEENMRKRAEEMAAFWQSSPRKAEDVTTALKRRDSAWWLRRFRREAADARQFFAAALRCVGKHSPYCPTHSVKVWRQRQAAARSFAAKRMLVRADGRGDPISMAEVQAASVKATVSRVYVMMRAVSSRARERGEVPFFVTLTLPGVWHPNPSKGRRSWTAEHHPKAADAELTRMWQAVRKLWNRADVTVNGFWSKEPHADGCIHMHAVVWVSPDREEAMRTAITEVFGEGIGAKVETINEDVAKAETYAMAYVLKSFNADPADTMPADQRPANDNQGEDGLGHFEAVRAHMCERRLRRFAFLGEAHGLQRTWQTVAAWKEPPPEASDDMRNAWEAMQAAEFDTALEILTSRNEEGERFVHLVYEERETRYLETRRAVVGLADRRTGEVVMRTAWTVVEVDAPKGEGDHRGTLADSFPRGGGAALPPANGTGQGASTGPQKWPPRTPGEAPTSSAAAAPTPL